MERHAKEKLMKRITAKKSTTSKVQNQKSVRFVPILRPFSVLSPIHFSYLKIDNFLELISNTGSQSLTTASIVAHRISISLCGFTPEARRDLKKSSLYISVVSFEVSPIVIISLGARIPMIDGFDPSATHFIFAKPQRSEKYLAACAAGKWFYFPSSTSLNSRVLREEYLHRSKDAGHFLGEEPFEWSSQFLSSSQSQSLNGSAYFVMFTLII